MDCNTMLLLVETPMELSRFVVSNYYCAATIVQVNLVPGDEPEDLYSEVARLV